ncbi:protachykinin [Myxocyprinus asiaticus]|uniref:protachykinin n=1 Tax=Myxocyprinus asiaticus TaxID=70543 RepID=UPI0022219A09|nr:protachykinin [Myxocyprinus asiaticus]
MKICLLILLLISALTNILCQNFNPDEENWINDEYPNEVNLLESEPLQTMLKRVNQAPGLQQYFGLMGKRSSAKSQITRRRQKFQTFVGLMGKRNVTEPGSF